MILLDGSFEVHGVTLYRDHVAPKHFHYLPGPPRAATAAGLQLIRFRGAQRGGVLTLDADLAWPEETLSSVRAELEARAGSAVTLAPVLFRSGLVRVTALGAAATPGTDAPASLVERVLGATEPSLLGRQRVSFSLALSAEGAALARVALEGGAAPMVLAYELDFVGLRPARGLRARIHYHLGYEYLHGRAQAAALWTRADVDREAEALRREGLVEIDDVDYRGDDAATLEQRRREAEATVRELVETLFFRPSSSPWTLGVDGVARDPATRAAWERDGRPRAAFALRALRQDEEQTLGYDLTEMSVAQRTVAPQGPLRLPVGTRVSDHVLDVDLDEAAPATLRALCPPDADWSGVGAIVVDLRSGDEVRSLTLTPAQPDASTTLPAASTEHRVRVLRDLGARVEEAPVWKALTQRTLVLDPAALSGRRSLEIVAGRIDPTVVKRIEVRVWQDDAHDDFVLAVEQPTVRVSVGVDARVRVEATLTLVDRQELVVKPRVTAGDALVLFDVPSDLFRAVTIDLQDPLDRYEAVIVELERAEGETRRVVRVDREGPTARWWYPPVDGGAGGFRYRERKMGRDGSERQEAWRDARGALLLVGDVDLRVETITGVLMAPADHLGALVTLTSLAPPPDAPAEVECMLDAGATEFRATLPFLRDAPRRYRARAQVFLEGGERTADLPDERDEVLVIELAQP